MIELRRAMVIMVGFMLSGLQSARAQGLADLLEEADQQRPGVKQAEETPKGTVSPPAASKPQVKQLPMPPTAARAQAARQKVLEVFAAEFAAAKTVSGKRDLSKQLADHATALPDPTERWVVLSEALQLAIDAGDAQMGVALVERLCSEYVTDEAATLESLTSLAAKASPPDSDVVCRSMLAEARRWGEAGLYTLASKAVSTVSGLARKTKNADLAAAATRLAADLREEQKTAKAEALISDKLLESPGDGDVCLEAARFYIYKRNDWDRGLPLLAKGSRRDLAEAAKSELTAGEAPGRLLILADLWWDLADSEDGIGEAAIQAHAADLYRRTLGSLSGLDKVRIEKRIATVTSSGRKGGNSPSKQRQGLVLWLDASDTKNFDPPIRRGADVSPVAVWRDLSDRRHDAKQPGTTLQPVWRRDAFGAKPGVTFNGSQTLAIDMPCGPAGSIIVVTTSKAQKSQRLFGCIDKPGGYLGLSLRPDARIWGEASVNETKLCIAQSEPGTYRAGDAVVIGQTWGASGLRLFSHRGVLASQAAVDQGISKNCGWGVGGGTLKMAVEYLEGSIAEAMVFDRQLEAQELEPVIRELVGKWECK